MAPSNYDSLLLSLFILLPSVFFLRLGFLLLDLLWRVGGTHRGTLLPTDSLATFTLAPSRTHLRAFFDPTILLFQGWGRRDIARGEREREKRRVLSLALAFVNAIFFKPFKKRCTCYVIPRVYRELICILSTFPLTSSIRTIRRKKLRTEINRDCLFKQRE